MGRGTEHVGTLCASIVQRCGFDLRIGSDVLRSCAPSGARRFAKAAVTSAARAFIGATYTTLNAAVCATRKTLQLRTGLKWRLYCRWTTTACSDARCVPTFPHIGGESHASLRNINNEGGQSHLLIDMTDCSHCHCRAILDQQMAVG